MNSLTSNSIAPLPPTINYKHADLSLSSARCHWCTRHVAHSRINWYNWAFLRRCRSLHTGTNIRIYNRCAATNEISSQKSEGTTRRCSETMKFYRKQRARIYLHVLVVCGRWLDSNRFILLDYLRRHWIKTPTSTCWSCVTSTRPPSCSNYHRISN